MGPEESGLRVQCPFQSSGGVSLSRSRLVVEAIERNLEGSGFVRFGRRRKRVRGREITSKRRRGDVAVVDLQAATHREHVRIEGMVFV